jgi:nucleoside-triphosphatase THEP1
MNHADQMTTSNIIIFTGPVKSGKTTFLVNMLKSRNDCGGFLTPDINGRRHFFRLDTKECLPFELEKPSDGKQIVEVGPYQFDKNIFDLGNHLISNFYNNKHKFFVIDEVGKLELRGEGFDLSLNKILPLYSLYDDTLLILIVRDYLVHEVVERYKLNCDVIDILQKDKIQLKLGF